MGQDRSQIPGHGGYQSPYPFRRTGGARAAALTNTGATPVALPATIGDQLLITNLGDEHIYIEVDLSTVEASTSSQCILSGTQVLLSIPILANDRNPTHFAVFSVAGTQEVQVSRGWGY